MEKPKTKGKRAAENSAANNRDDGRGRWPSVSILEMLAGAAYTATSTSVPKGSSLATPSSGKAKNETAKNVQKDITDRKVLPQHPLRISFVGLIERVVEGNMLRTLVTETGSSSQRSAAAIPGSGLHYDISHSDEGYFEDFPWRL